MNKDVLNTTKTSPSSSRPKTSRKKPIPSPDEFTDYVVPSPDPVAQAQVNVVRVHDEYVLKSRVSTQVSPSARDYDQVIRLGCWLFGAGLKA